MRKFYKAAEAGTAPDGYVIRLDGKPAKTPLKKTLLLKSKLLAEEISKEWALQAAVIKPATMPLTQLANTLLDKAKGADRVEMGEQLASYGGSDLVCYFADHPESLVKLHEKHWRPLIAWMKDRHGIVLEVVSGIKYQQQPEESLERLQKLINSLSPEDFTVVQAASATTGSVIIALALSEGRFTPEEAYEAACVDEIYQLKTWGEDAEARKRLDVIKAELDAIVRFRDLVKATS